MHAYRHRIDGQEALGIKHRWCFTSLQNSILLNEKNLIGLFNWIFINIFMLCNRKLLEYQEWKSHLVVVLLSIVIISSFFFFLCLFLLLRSCCLWIAADGTNGIKFFQILCCHRWRFKLGADRLNPAPTVFFTSFVYPRISKVQKHIFRRFYVAWGTLNSH